MSNNTTLNSGSGGDVIQTVDNTSYKTPVATLADSTGTTFVKVGVNNALTVAGDVAQGATDSGNVLKIGGVYNSTNPTLGNGQRSALQVDSAGNLNVNYAAQTYYHSTNNSYVGSVTTGTPFTGTIETVFNQPNCQLLVNTTQNATVVVNQYITGSSTTLCKVSTFTVAANSYFAQNIQVYGNYLNVVFTNTGGSSATVNIDTAYGVLDTLPTELTNSGNLKVAVLESLPAGTNSVGTVVTNADVSSAAGTSSTKALLTAGVYNTSLPTLTTGQSGALQLDSTSRLIVSVASAPTTAVTIATAPVLVAGSAIIGKVGIDQTTVGSTNAVSISQIGATTVVTGGLAGSFGVGGLAASGASISGNPVMIGSTFTSTQPTVTTGQAVNVQSTARGALMVSLQSVDNTVSAAGYVRLTDGTTQPGVIVATTALKTDMSSIAGTATVTGGVAGTQAVGGITANLASSTGNPVYTGGLALLSAPTKATNGQRAAFATDSYGRILTTLNSDRTLTGVTQTTITASTSATTIVAAVASTFCDITHLSVTNGSATATNVTLINNAVTYGIWNISAGGGIILNLSTPFAANLVNTAWTLTCGTSVSSVYVVASWIKNT